MNIAPDITARVHSFNSVCAYDADVIRDVPIDGFGVELQVTHHGGGFFIEGDRVTRHEGGVALFRMTATQARKVRDDIDRILQAEAEQRR